MKLLLFVFLFLSPCLLKAETVTVKVQGLSCGICGESLTKKIKENKEVKDVKVDLDNFQVVIETSSKIEDKKIKDIMLNSGFNVTDIKRNP